MSKLKKIKVKAGMRVTNAPMNGDWGTVLEVIDMRKAGTSLSARLKAKGRRPFIYVIQWDNGKIERTKQPPWFPGDDPGFGRPILIDPGAKNEKA